MLISTKDWNWNSSIPPKLIVIQIKLQQKYTHRAPKAQKGNFKDKRKCTGVWSMYNKCKNHYLEQTKFVGEPRKKQKQKVTFFSVGFLTSPLLTPKYKNLWHNTSRKNFDGKPFSPELINFQSFKQTLFAFSFFTIFTKLFTLCRLALYIRNPVGLCLPLLSNLIHIFDLWTHMSIGHWMLLLAAFKIPTTSLVRSCITWMHKVSAFSFYTSKNILQPYIILWHYQPAVTTRTTMY